MNKEAQRRIDQYDTILNLRNQGLGWREIERKYHLAKNTPYKIIGKGRPSLSADGKTTFIPNSKKFMAGRDIIRMKVRRRDRFTCRDCRKRRTPSQVDAYNANYQSLKGRMKLFDIHHLNGQCGKKSKGYDLEKDMHNLITLCHKCHYNRPEHKTRTKAFGASISRGHRKRREAKNVPNKPAHLLPSEL